MEPPESAVFHFPMDSSKNQPHKSYNNTPKKTTLKSNTHTHQKKTQKKPTCCTHLFLAPCSPPPKRKKTQINKKKEAQKEKEKEANTLDAPVSSSMWDTPFTAQVWTRPQGIQATENVPGAICLRHGPLDLALTPGSRSSERRVAEAVGVSLDGDWVGLVWTLAWEMKAFSTRPPEKLSFLRGGIQQQPRSGHLFFSDAITWGVSVTCG